MGKKKDKEYYYKQKIKGGLNVSIIATVLAVIILIVINVLINNNAKFIETAVETEAVIKDIKYVKEIEREEIKSVEVAYNVNGKEYRSNLNQTNSKMYKGKTVSIYYNPENPEEIILNDNNSLYIFEIIMCIILVFCIGSTILSLKKVIIYYSTLNGREVDADVVKINEKTLFGKKNFVIQCKWVDEKGVEYIFNSLNYTEPYFIHEFDKMHIEKLKVRFKENNISKYVVITEKIDRKLAK